jgi:hypothetical protein
MAPCSRCEKSKRPCVAPRDTKLSRCAEYTRQGKTCDVRQVNRMPEVFEWESLEEKRRKVRALKKQEMVRLQEASARLQRLEKEEDALDEKEQRMIAAGLNSLDELDELERKEQQEEEEKKEREEREAEVERLSAHPTPPVDYSGYDPSLLDPNFDPRAFWGALDTGGGTFQAASGS